MSVHIDSGVVILRVVERWRGGSHRVCVSLARLLVGAGACVIVVVWGGESLTEVHKEWSVKDLQLRGSSAILSGSSSSSRTPCASSKSRSAIIAPIRVPARFTFYEAVRSFPYG